ncbi:MAG: RNA polymerase sigma factor [Victivallaceae bacterium]
MDKMIDLEKTLQAARCLNAKAMATLCEYYYYKILKFMYYRVGQNDAEDITSEVFMKVMRSIESQSGNFEAWLYRIARNTIIDKARYRNARPEIELKLEYDEDIDENKNMEKQIGSMLDVEFALGKINDEYRELLVMKFIQGLSNDEIAEITGRSQGAIRIMQFRALKSMRAVLKNGDDHNV